MTILTISPRSEFSEQLSKILASPSAQATSVSDSQQGLKILKDRRFDFVILDSRLQDLSLEKLIRKVVEKSPLSEIVLAFENAPALNPSNLASYGADEIIDIPPLAEEVSFKIKNLWQARQNLVACGLTGRSPELKSVAEQALQIAPSDITVLITGESGVGKELIARAIHNNSTRKQKPLLAVNCAAFAEGVLESELFGHEKGSFTGAVSRKLGVFEAAAGGTIFLDEIGELKPSTQVKLLRVLEEKEIMRVGGTERIRVNARVAAATNRDLAQAVEQGVFRRDLYYRLAVVKIFIPPLRERPADIPILVYEFINQLQRSQPSRKIGIADSAIEALQKHHWPGNVRELKNFIESSVALSRTGKIEQTDAVAYIQKQAQSNRNLPVVTGLTPTAAEHELIFQALSSLRSEIFSLKNLIQKGLEQTGNYPSGWDQPPVTPAEVDGTQESLDVLEKEHIEKVLRQVGGNRRKAAEILGIGERTLYRKIRLYRLK